MEKSIVKLVTDQVRFQDEVRGRLEEAKSAEMVDVLIVGSMPGGQFYMSYSPSMNRAEQIGFMEQAKHRILTSIVAGEDREG